MLTDSIDVPRPLEAFVRTLNALENGEEISPAELEFFLQELRDDRQLTTLLRCRAIQASTNEEHIKAWCDWLKGKAEQTESTKRIHRLVGSGL